jgi:hypothetical protein
MINMPCQAAPQLRPMNRTPRSSPRPTNQDVRRHLVRLQRQNPRLLSLRTVLETSEGRPIDAATVTDPDADPARLQHVLIVAGQHGNEESGRMIALRLLDHLVSEVARPLRRRQKIVVMPNISPDAAARDAYETPAGIRPNLDHGRGGAVSPEGRALEIVAGELAPELFVDMHARGHAGCSHDMVLFPPARPYTEDENLLYAIAHAMARAGERSGIPHVVHPLSWPGWGGPDPDQPSSTLHLYRQYKSLVFMTETSESNTAAHPAAMRAAAGLARLLPLLALGNRRHPCLPDSGYPCGCAVGMFHAAAFAVGPTAADRRASRLALWRNASSFRRLTPVFPEGRREKVLQVHYDGPPIPTAAGFQVRLAGRRRVRSIALNGRQVGRDDSRATRTWYARSTTFALLSLPDLRPGEHEIVFRFS